ncbi:MAG: dihydrolipoyl dehydrogenase [Candidatus Cloacimonadaceae bacterium]|nr:dihydrolipoyl dehydrogenase [Candidatus Cloacimonadaceae bacterium]
MYNYQVLIIGGGPGGYETAVRLNQYGITTAVIEKDRIGGICLNWGCIPTKALVKSAELYGELKEAELYGLAAYEPNIEYTKVFERKNKIVEQLVGGLEFIFHKRKIPIINEMAVSISKATDGWKVQTVDGNAYSAEYLIIATGSVPKELPGISIDEKDILSSTGILQMETLPKSLAVVGGGVIGCEFASIMNTFGAETHIIEFLPRLVSSEDEEISKRLAMALKKAGIRIMTGSGVQSITKTEAGLKLSLNNGTEITVEKVLLSVGRVPQLNIAFTDQSLATEHGAVSIDSAMRTNLPKVYAIGDVTGKMQLAHTASKQGMVAAQHIDSLVKNKEFHYPELEYINIPRCTFTHPELASVGFTEAEAKDRFGDVLVGKFPFSASGKALAMGNTFGFVKTIARADSNQLVGMHILGPNAAELIAQGAILISQGATAEAIESIVFAHPTLSEALKESIEDIRSLSIHKI